MRKTELEDKLASAALDNFFKMDVGYMLVDLRKLFEEEEDFKLFVEVLKESLGEFLTDVYSSGEENVTIENLFRRLKKIAERRFDEA